MIDVTCAIIRNEDDEILVVQRAEYTDHPMKWEFPGGKVNNGESLEECIVREIEEELSIDVVICGTLPAVQYDYPNKSVRLIPFICDTLDDMPFLSEHIDFKWIDAEKLLSVDFSEADIIVAENYLSHISKQSACAPDSAVPDNNDLKSMVTGMMGTRDAEWIASSAADNPQILLNLIEYSFSDDKKLAFRSSWTLTKVWDRFPDMIYPHLGKLSELLPKLTNESAQRSFLRIISLANLNKIGVKHHGILADFCFTSLKSGFSAIAVKAYSMEILYRLTAIYPELKNELLTTINMLHGDETAGVIARGKQITKKLTRKE